MTPRASRLIGWILLPLFTACTSNDDGSGPSASAGSGALGAGAGATQAGGGAGGTVASNGGQVSSAGSINPGGTGGLSETSRGGAPQGGGSAGTPSSGSAGGGASGGGSGGASGSGSAAGGAFAGGAAGDRGSPPAAGAAGHSGGAGAGGVSGADPKFLVFLLLGQSNMEGNPQPQAQDREQDPRVRVLAYDNCPNVNRKYNEWHTASPPLHSCGAGLGPGDYFAKTLLASLPADYTIGLVPCAVNGAPIDTFRKGIKRTGYVLPPDNHWETGYEWIVSRAQFAQKSGVIRGILFHQGESDFDQAVWVDKVRGLVTDLRTDLGIGDVPFLAGELYHRGCCARHNTLVKQVADSLTNGFVISAEGLNGTDQYHFDVAAQRELGTRYGTTMSSALQPLLGSN